jgi:AcrR family transcriptional regulator
MSQGAFYRHFADKNEALIDAMSGPLQQLLDSITWASSDPGNDLVALVHRHAGFFRVYAHNAALFRVMREAAAIPESGFKERWLDMRDRFLARIEEWLRDLCECDVLEDRGDLHLLAAALGTMLDQLAYTKIALADVPPRPEELAAIGRITAEVWHAAIATRATGRAKIG